jgi:ADP-ribose pyrophosphatase YjhB (NUDIX family)
MVSDPQAKTVAAAHTVLAVVFQVRGGRLEVLLWERALDPCSGCWSLPGGELAPDETLEESIRRHLAAKVDVRELSHIEQLETLSEPDRSPARRELATAYLGLVPSDVDPALPDDTRWHPVDKLPKLAFDHARVVLAGRERLRAKLSYTNAGFALAPETFTLSELRDHYRAALGHDVPMGSRRESGPTGGRPAAVYRFERRELQITDQFAVLRPQRASTPPAARPRRGRA